jgi:hypothetical protein
LGEVVEWGAPSSATRVSNQGLVVLVMVKWGFVLLLLVGGFAPFQKLIGWKLIDGSPYACATRL